MAKIWTIPKRDVVFVLRVFLPLCVLTQYGGILQKQACNLFQLSNSSTFPRHFTRHLLSQLKNHNYASLSLTH